MSEATVVFPHQLFAESPAVVDGRPIYLVEEPLLLTFNPTHRQKLIFHKLSLDAYEHQLVKNGHAVIRLTIHDSPTTDAIFKKLRDDGIQVVHIVDTTDDYLERAISTSGLERVWYESPLFWLPKTEAINRYQQSKRSMASFYKQFRRDYTLLLDDAGEPIGGRWSFDADNRQKIPRTLELPTDIHCYDNQETTAAAQWAASLPVAQYGESGCWLPYTHAGAEAFLQEFFRTRFHHFGPYEDAMHTEHTRLWHSTISPLLNVGLLTPRQVVTAAIAYAAEHAIPINSLEGFVRQIIGWREFIRASYEAEGRTMRQQNFWQHTNRLPQSFWTGTTNILPVDQVISTALQFGYTHHIERLMVMGNFMLLCGIQPTDVYRWFMGMYVDAYDWVMVPNVYGMSQFADGGSFATKPYISGSNYLKKMSNFPGGDWEDTWTSLYWHFIAAHRTVFAQNHRLAMMPRLLDGMSAEKRSHHTKTATEFLARFNC